MVHLIEKSMLFTTLPHSLPVMFYGHLTDLPKGFKRPIHLFIPRSRCGIGRNIYEVKAERREKRRIGYYFLPKAVVPCG